MRHSLFLLAFLFFPVIGHAQDATPGSACTLAGAAIATGASSGSGNLMVCEGGIWKTVLGFSSAAQITKIGNQTCNTNETLKFDGTKWACAAGGVTGSGTTNYISKFTSTTALGSSIIFDDGSNVGIGTSSPSTKLQVLGTATATTFSGSGASLTNLPAANLTGTLPAISGANLTSLSAGNISSGTVAAARLGSGSSITTKYLRGDNTWQTVSSGGFTTCTTVSGGGTPATATCAGGYTMTGGGCSCNGQGGTLYSNSYIPTANGWRCSVSSSAEAYTCTAYARCCQ